MSRRTVLTRSQPMNNRVQRVLTGAALLLLMVPFMVTGQSRPDALELYRQGRFDQAAEVTLQEIRDNPSNLDAYTVLGWSLLALNRDAEALEYGLAGLQVSRFDHRIVNIVGEAHYRMGSYTDALQYMQNYAGYRPHDGGPSQRQPRSVVGAPRFRPGDGGLAGSRRRGVSGSATPQPRPHRGAARARSRHRLIWSDPRSRFIGSAILADRGGRHGCHQSFRASRR